MICGNCQSTTDSDDVLTLPDGSSGCDKCGGECVKCGATVFAKDGRHVDDGWTREWWCVKCLAEKYRLELK